MPKPLQAQKQGRATRPRLDTQSNFVTVGETLATASTLVDPTGQAQMLAISGNDCHSKNNRQHAKWCWRGKMKPATQNFVTAGGGVHFVMVN